LEYLFLAGTSFYQSRSVFVSGAGGFIGSHLVEALVAAGARVRAMLRYSSRADRGNLEYLDKRVLDEIEIIRGDIRDPHFMLQALEGQEIVFHLAALIAIPYSYIAPSEYVAANVTGTVNVLESARRNGVTRFLQTSTSEVYGTAQFRPINESHPLVGQSPYSASKIGADKLAESFYRSFDLPVVTVRPFNTYGPRQSARAVVPTILAQLLSGCDRLQLGSIDPERDLTHARDTAAGMLALAACDEAVGLTVNLGSGSALTIGQIAEKCMSITGKQVPLKVDPRRIRPEKSEVLALISDNRLARQLCGWQPTITLEHGLKECADFMKDHLALFHPEEYQR
jgi:NAD dependent epimerase/dehydratase